MDRTVAIIDFAHCGTTMVAGICEILGVPMVIGKHHHPMKWEDRDIIDAIYTKQDEDILAALVKERNMLYNSWGFKLPGAWLYASMLKRHLRDPAYLVIYKDPVSVTQRRFGKSEVRSLRKTRNTIRQYQTSIDGLYSCGLRPIHMLSYHRAVVTPDAFVEQIATIIGFDGDVELISKAAEYIQPNKAGPRAHYPGVEPWI